MNSSSTSVGGAGEMGCGFRARLRPIATMNRRVKPVTRSQKHHENAAFILVAFTVRAVRPMDR